MKTLNHYITQLERCADELLVKSEETRIWLQENNPLYLKWTDDGVAYYRGLQDRINGIISENQMQELVKNFDESFKAWNVSISKLLH